MRLSAEQLKAFDEQGYVFFPNCFSEEEIALLRTEADKILKLDRQEVWREKTGAPRTAFAVSSNSATVRLVTATSAPWSARPIAMARPSPRPPPVTSAFLPVRSKSADITSDATHRGNRPTETKRPT